jgi:methyl-accepting chemotaxis protein
MQKRNHYLITYGGFITVKLKFRLTIINGALTLALITIIAVVFLIKANSTARDAALETMRNAAGLTAADIKERYEAYRDIAETLSIIMNSYESVDVELRRLRYSEILESIITSYPQFVQMYTLWKPNTLTDDDAAYIGENGTSATGQFVPCYTRENGALQLRAHHDFQSALASAVTVDTISNPTTMKVNGVDTYVIDIHAPIIVRGGVVGLVGITVDTNLLETLVEKLEPYGTGYGAVYSHDGSVAAHRDKANRGTNFQTNSAIGATLGTQGVALVRESLNTGEPRTIITNQSILVSFPYSIGSSTTPWTVMSVVPLATVMAPVTALIKFALVFVAVAVILGVIVIYLVSSNLSTRILRVADRMQDIAQGEGDLTGRIKILAKDEIGTMALDFNQIIEKIQRVIINIKQQSHTLSNIGSELASNMTETAASVNEIAATIQSIKGQASNQSESVSATNNTMGEITSNIERLNVQIETQADSVSQSSSAIEQMLANIASVTQTLVRNAQNVKNLAQASEVGRTGLQEVAADIQEIAKESEGLLEITSVMENIASQTNLLSMNAAIEAAHAGESGKGFAVVADEIRKLAESSGEQSKTIATILKKIKESIDRIAQSTDMVIDRFEAIDYGVKTVSEQEENVRSAMEEQGSGSQQILESIGKLNDITQTIKQGSGEMLTGSRKVMEESKHLEALTLQITDGTNQMANGADLINAAVARVSAITDENKSSIDVLVDEVSKFKVEE